MPDLAADVEAYAALAAELADLRTDRAAVLAAHGLDEDAWDALDERWQDRLSAAEEAHGDADGVPPLVAAHAEAFVRAQRARVREVLPFERFLAATRALRRGGDLAATLKRLDLTLETYLAAQAHWTARVLEDEALAARFDEAMKT